MAKKLQPMSIRGPGSWGLNLEDQRNEIDPRWAIKALNCVISDSGVITSRKGYKSQNTALSGEPPIEQIHEYIDNANITVLISAADNKLYQGTNSLTEVTGSITTPTSNNWKFQNFNGKVVGFQENHTPIVKDGSGSSNTFSDISGTTSMPNGNEVLAAFGRLWATDSDRTTIKYSDLLDETEWDAGSSGSLDTYSVWTNGSDEVVAIGSFKDRLVIFGKFEILIYTGTSAPNTTPLALEDVIKGIGCVARDSVANIGDDILFLSASGVQSLSRAIQGGDIPLNDVSVKVRSELLSDLQSETASNIRSVYHATDGYYLLTMPTSKHIWVFDVAHRVPELGLPRVLLWDNLAPTSLTTTREGNLFFGMEGVVAKYGGGSTKETYQDDGIPYRLEMKTGRTSGQSGPVEKIFKYLKLSVTGGYGIIATMVWDYDYRDFVESAQEQIQLGSPTYWEIGTFEDKWASELTTDELFYPLSGVGNNMSFELRHEVDGFQIIIHRFDVFMKQGRLG